VTQGTETGEAATATLELAEWLDGKVLQDLDGFERLWLIYALHRSEGWRSTVKPPRGGPKRGVLATRSPHRPNAIGLSATPTPSPTLKPVGSTNWTSNSGAIPRRDRASPVNAPGRKNRSKNEGRPK